MMDYNIVEQGLTLEEKQYQTSHKKPADSFLTYFDFSMEALNQNKVSGIYYLMFASFYGSYYYALVVPHSMYMVTCSGLSFFFLVGWLNYKMNLALCVADA